MPLVPVRLQPANVATPAVVAFVSVVVGQARVGTPPLTDRVIESGVVTTLFAASSTVTWGWGVNAAPFTAAPNVPLVNTRWVAAPKSASAMSPLSPVTVPLSACSV